MHPDKKIRVARLAFSRPKNKKIGLFIKSVGLEIFENLLSSWPIFKSIEVYIVKSKNFPFLKQSLAFLSYKLMATLDKILGFMSD